MWECGLKQSEVLKVLEADLVTPYVGVWIETPELIENGLHIIVTPYVGVWIETYTMSPLRLPGLVTPYVGVWIETCRKGLCL